MRHKLFWFFFILILLVVLGYFSTQIYLYVRLLIGNDLVLKITPDKENFFALNGQSESVEFRTRIAANPFCFADCNSKFWDLSEDTLIEGDSFGLNPASWKTKSYEIPAPDKGTGQKLYRFEVECATTRTVLCRTDERVRRDSVFVTLNYDLSEDKKKILNETKVKIEEFARKNDDMSYKSRVVEQALTVYGARVYSDPVLKEGMELKNNFSELNAGVDKLKDNWERGEYDSLESDVANYSVMQESFESDFNDYLNKTRILLYKYNGMIDTFVAYKGQIDAMRGKNLSMQSFLSAQAAVDAINLAAVAFSDRNSLSEKQEIMENLTAFMSGLNFSGEDSCCAIDKQFLNISASKIELSFGNHTFVGIVLKGNGRQCCFDRNCTTCCEDSCDSKEYYPVIFLHGHDFNRYVSSESSLQTFVPTQARLEQDGYIDAGSLLISQNSEEVKGILGEIRKPVSVRASYYFDLYKNEGKGILIETKTDNLDTYAIRLREIVEAVKYKTGKDKVVIVAHSMGGLVARRYVQVFGGQSVDKMILIGTPNHGVRGDVEKYCGIFGAGDECEDMKPDSLFLNKLNSEKQNVPIYNIIGVGCVMGEETGDGIVLKSDAELDYATNYYMPGSCEVLKYAHGDLIDPEKMPGVYDTIVEILKK